MAYCVGYKHPKRGYLFLQHDLKTFSSFPDFWNDETAAEHVVSSYRKSILNRDIGNLLEVVNEDHLPEIDNAPHDVQTENKKSEKRKSLSDVVLFDGRDMENFKDEFNSNEAFLTALRQTVAFIEAMDDELEKGEKEVFYEELKIMDIEHYMEFNAFNDEEGVILSKMIETCRKRRRTAKDRVDLLQIFKRTLEKDYEKAAPIVFPDIKKKLSTMDNRVYVPRVLKSLFDDGVPVPDSDGKEDSEMQPNGQESVLNKIRRTFIKPSGEAMCNQ